MAFYTGDRFPDWKNNVLVGAMLGGAVQGIRTSSGSCSMKTGTKPRANPCSRI